MPSGLKEKSTEQVAKYADMFSAMGTEPRLRIMQLLLSAHPEGLVVGDIQGELEIPNSTLSHHLDKLKNEGLVQVKRESTFLRYTANTEALQELLQLVGRVGCTIDCGEGGFRTGCRVIRENRSDVFQLHGCGANV